MYALLTDDEMLGIRRERLLDLERTHYRTVIHLSEMDGLGAPAEAPGRVQLLRDLEAITAAIGWHRHELGIDLDGDGRVGTGGMVPTGDDESGSDPVGEEQT